MGWSAYGAVLCLISAALLLAGCGREAGKVRPPQFAGSKSCGECHAAEAAAWRRSFHAQSMTVATPATVRGDFEAAPFASGARAVQFRRSKDRYYVTTTDRRGRLREFRVKYTFGAYPLQQYLVQTKRGRLQALDVAWDTRPLEAGGQRWFRLREGEPGADAPAMHWAGPAFNWNHQCADCHSTGVRKRYDAHDNSFATTFAEVNVACEACHGPAAAHVDWQRRQRHSWTRWFSGPPPAFVVPLRNAPADGRRAQLFDPQRPLDFTPGAELQVCAQCHSRRTQVTAAFDVTEGYSNHYVPEPLNDPQYFVDGQIRDEVFEYGSFLQSRMFGKGVTCGDCHEPHSLALRRDGNGLCLGCHEARYAQATHHRHREDSPGARCIECHMPARTYMTVDPRRDHSFRVPRPDLSVAYGVPNACSACHANRPAQWAADQVTAWFGPHRAGLQNFAAAFDAIRRQTADAESAIDALLGDPATPGIVKATALAESGPFLDESRLGWVRRGLASTDPSLRLAALAACESLPPDWRWSVAAASLGDPVRTVRIRAAQVLGAVPALDGERARALEAPIRELREAFRANADRAAWRAEEGAWLQGRGDGPGARGAFEAALALDPAFTPAAVNRADLERALGRDDRGEAVLVAALVRDPDDAALQHALGLLRARQKRYDEALVALRRAVQLAPGDAGYRYAEAVALQSLGRRSAAISALERHRAAGRTSRSETVLLARLLAAAGDRTRFAALEPELRALARVDRGVAAALEDLGACRVRQNDAAGAPGPGVAR